MVTKVSPHLSLLGLPIWYRSGNLWAYSCPKSTPENGVLTDLVPESQAARATGVVSLGFIVVFSPPCNCKDARDS